MECSRHMVCQRLLLRIMALASSVPNSSSSSSETTSITSHHQPNGLAERAVQLVKRRLVKLKDGTVETRFCVDGLKTVSAVKFTNIKEKNTTT